MLLVVIAVASADVISALENPYKAAKTKVYADRGTSYTKTKSYGNHGDTRVVSSPLAGTTTLSGCVAYSAPNCQKNFFEP